MSDGDANGGGSFKSKARAAALSSSTADVRQRRAAPVLSAAAQQQLLQENHALLNRLKTDVDAAREIERSVARVGALQRTFASKVAEQAEQIDHVHNVLTDAGAAVVKGNEELALAAAHGVDFRIFVLLFLITLTVALLFLDWY